MLNPKKLGGLLLFYAIASQAEPNPIVVELFTSQGCHSCPPADQYLGKLSQQADIIALSCHVSYWDYLGWKDSFSNKFCDQRQRAYQPFLQGYQGVYTPQMVLNGRFTQVGSRQASLNKAIDILRKEDRVHPIDIQGDQKQLNIELPNLKPENKYQLYLLGTSGVHEIPISRGENGGKHLTYHHPVEVSFDLGTWNGDQKTLNHPLSEQDHIEQWVIIAQEYPLGAVLAAGKLTLAADETRALD